MISVSSSYLAGKAAKFVEAHAVQVIGYNNEQEYWLAKNSWGSGFADGGYFKIVFGAAGICDEARGLIFTAFNPLPPPLGRVRLVETKPGCFNYRATSWDYVSQVATVFKVAPQKVLLDNVNVIYDPGMFLRGVTVVLCGIDLPVAVGTGAPGRGSISQLDALLDIKLAIDSRDVLKSWTKSSGADGGYCKWSGIMCDGNNNVLNVGLEGNLNGNLNGVLPDIGALQALPKLVTLNLLENGLQGTLPTDWSALSNLQELFLRGNQLSGPLPAQWSAMSNLQVLFLISNKLSGPLPAAWGSMASLRELAVTDNQLTGPLPAEWSRMGNMIDLRLGKNKVSGSLPGQWSAMSELRVLQLAMNDLTGLLSPEWGRFAKLEGLSLQFNKLSGPLPGQWGNMTKLITLNVGGNQLSGAVPAAQWKGMASLGFIYLWGNSQLSGCLPAAWKGRVNLPGSMTVFGDGASPEEAYGPGSGTKVTGFCP